MKPSILLYQSLPSYLLRRLNEHFELIDVSTVQSQQSAQYQQQMREASGILARGGFKLGESQLQQYPALRAVSTISVGYDSYDVAALSKHHVLLCHTPKVLDETVADTVFALMLASARRVVELAQWMAQGQWQSSLPSSKFGLDVHHKKLGIIGMGRIAMAVAQRAHCGFGMSISYYNRSAKPEAEERFAAQRLELNELLEQSDFVVVLVPLTPQTYHLLDRDTLSKLGPNAILINAARGDVVDEAALIELLQQGKFAGAGLDVYHQEPLPADSPLLSLPQVVTLPHIGSATQQTRDAMAELAVDNLIAALTHQPLQNCVNPEAAR